MKKSLFALLIGLLLTMLNGRAQIAASDYVTTWKTDHPGTSTANQITIPAAGEYTLYYESIPAGTSGTLPAVGTFTDAQTITLPAAGTYRIAIKPTGATPFHRIDFSNGGDKLKLLTIEQWGTTVWSSMQSAYFGCSNLTAISATDAPVLSSVTAMTSTFRGCSALASAPNMNNWNVSNVVNMFSLFSSATSFNQPIGNWNVSNVVDMSTMFSFATSFNQPIGNWNVSNVMAMTNMFFSASAFNQPIGNWDVSKVTNMNSMFANATSFNQPIGNWNVSKVTTMISMFSGASAFNQSLNSWNVSKVTNMNQMFYNASAFNQPLNNWDVSKVTDMSGMFFVASTFNRPLDNWNLNANVNLANILSYTGMDCTNYSNTLIGWAVNPATPSGRTLGATGTIYGPAATAARTTLTGPKGWTITGDFLNANCVLIAASDYVTAWKTDHPGTSNNNQITIPATGEYTLFYESIPSGTLGTLPVSGTFTDAQTITLPAAGTYRIAIKPTGVTPFHRIYFNNEGDRQKLLSIEQWGTTVWSSMQSAYSGCSNLTAISATDAPVLSSLTDMSSAFINCTSFTGSPNMNNWDVSNVTNMSFTFGGASVFNQPLGSWNVSNVTNMSNMFVTSAFNQPISSWEVSNVTDMSRMFLQATSFNQLLNWDVSNVTTMREMFALTPFNQPIGNWDVSNVTDMKGMFNGASAFNQPIGNWDVSKVTNMGAMFSIASIFNQPIGSWDVSKVTDMSFMFNGAFAFNHPLNSWTVSSATDMSYMFQSATSFNQPLNSWTLNANVDLTGMLNNSGMNCANYNTTLIGWAANPATPSGRTLGALGRTYGPAATAARTTLTGTKGWAITGDNLDPNCVVSSIAASDYVTTWKTDNPGTSTASQITIPATGEYTLYYESIPAGTSGTLPAVGTFTDAQTITLPAAGTYRIAIKPTGATPFHQIAFSNGDDREKLLTIEQWGTTVWSSMQSAYFGCSNLTAISATDAPVLSSVTDMSYAFYNCFALGGAPNMNNWNVSNVTGMSGMFTGATSFNQPIGSWNVSNVTNMNNMFYNATSFNQPIGSWNVGNVTDMRQMFQLASSFNQPLTGWDVSKVTTMNNMFSFTPFNQPIGSWIVGNVTDMQEMFLKNTAFNQPINSWDVSKVSIMRGMFNSASAFNQPLSGWNVSNVINMRFMFSTASAFNQPLNSWTVSSATDMTSMFQLASAFNQPLNNWTLNANVNLTGMLNNSGINCTNYSNTLIGWSANPATPSGLTLGASGLTYGAAATAARTNLTGTKGWTITGDNSIAAPMITPGGPTTFCTGGSVLLTSDAASGNQWYLNGNLIDGAANPTYSATASGSYTVVSTVAGCASAPSAAISVTVNQTPSMPTITPAGAAAFCSGGSFTLTSSAATGNQWYLNGNPIGGATNQTYAANAVGNYTVIVTLSGCASLSSLPTTVTITPKPADVVTNATICSGASYTWTANGQTYTTTQTGLTITNDGCTANQVLNLTVTPKPADVVTNATICSGASYTWTANGQTYTTTQTELTIINDGCTANQVLNLTVTPKPAPIVTNATICSGTSYTWAANGQTYTTMQTGLTITNNGCTANQILNLTVTPKPADVVTNATICSGASYTWTANGQTYTTTQTALTITNDNCTANQVLNLTVTPLPTAGISGTTMVCQNAPFPQITFTGNNGTAPYTLTYNINNGPDLTIDITSGNSVTVSQSTAAAGVFTYTLVSVKDASSNQCSQTQNGSATITVNAPPLVSSPVTTLCVGSTLTLSPTSGGTWLSSNPAIATVTNQGIVTAMAAGAVNFTFTSTANSCSATTSNVIIKPTPNSALTASKVDVCPNTEVSLYANCSIPNSTVHWNPGAPTVTPAAATLPYVYKASCTADGCTGNESSVEVRTHRILVDMKDLDVGTLPLPIARAVKDNMAPTNVINAPVFPRRWTFIANGCDASESAVFKLSGAVNFMAIDNAATYAMFANDAGGFYSIDHPNYGNGGNFPNGTYTLTVDLRNADGVGGPFPKNRVATGSLLATRTLQFTVGNSAIRMGAEEFTVSDSPLIEPFAQVSPNPISNTLHLQVSGAAMQKVNVRLLDASGRSLLQRDFVPQSNQHQEEIEVSHLPHGMYFIRVNTDQNRSTLKVIKVQ